MTQGNRRYERLPRRWAVCPCALAWLLFGFGAAVLAGAPLPDQPTLPQPLSLAQAVQITLEVNPELASLRQQRGLAAAGVVIARTYPHNPVTQSTVFGVTGPSDAGISNFVVNQHKVTLDVEVRGQRGFREHFAFAAPGTTE